MYAIFVKASAVSPRLLLRNLGSSECCVSHCWQLEMFNQHYYRKHIQKVITISKVKKVRQYVNGNGIIFGIFFDKTKN